jgi:general secretion pathway protein G
MAKLTERKVYFPRERRRLWLGARARVRMRFVILAFGVLGFLWFVHAREERAASVRATRAAIRNAFYAVMSYQAEHHGACPRDVAELQQQHYVARLPVDAWGKPLRLVCPGRRDVQGFDVLSDGPDGLPYGLDRVE